MQLALSDAARAFLAILLSISVTVPADARKPRKPPPPVVLSAPPAAAGTFSVTDAGQRWSDPKTWGGALPPAGATIVIPVGKTVILDTATPPLKGLVILGALRAADTNVAITSDYIMVRGGQLQIGTAAKPYTRSATITLTGSTTADLPGTTGFGAKVLGVMGGSLELQGAPAVTEWTQLGADVAAGARTLTLANLAGWKAGDEIVIATSGLDQAAHDVATIQSISGTQVTLTQPLKFKHLGAVRTVGTVAIDVRAEVGRLNRNIVVQGDLASTTSKIGGHTMFMAGNGGTSVRIAGAEFRRMGQLNQLGRYPIHFHLMAGDCNGCYIKDSSVRDTIQRGIVLHGTRGVTLAGNVVFNTVGHNIVVEDLGASGNLIDRNLALVNRQPKPLHTEPTLVAQEDRMPSNYWMRTAGNTVTRNRAAGSFFNGFNFIGENTEDENPPAGAPFDFRGNVAHAAMGREGAGAGDFDITGALLISGMPPRPRNDRIQDTLVYHSSTGLWPEESGDIVIDRFISAENGNGAENRGVSNNVTYRNGVFVHAFPGGVPGQSNSIHFQYGSDVRLDAPTFVNYAEGPFAATDVAEVPQGNLWINQARFAGTVPPRLPNGDLIVTFEDDSYGPRGTYAADPRHASLACPRQTFTFPDGEGGSESQTFLRCAERYGHAELDVRSNTQPTARIHQSVDVQRSDGLVFRGGMFGYSVLYGAGLGYTVGSAAPGGYSVRLHTTFLDGRKTPVDAEQAVIDSAVRVNAPPSGVFRTSTEFDGPTAPREADRMRPVASAAALASQPLAGYYYDPTTKLLHFKASVRWVTITP